MERRDSYSGDKLSELEGLGFTSGSQYSIKVCKGFIDLVADGQEHVDPPNSDLLQILWSECPRSDFMSEWRPDLDRPVRSVLLDWSNDMFHTLRADFIDALHAKYNARLIRIRSETLTFVFLHQDQDMKQMMAEKKWLYKKFSELLRTVPKGKLKVNVTVKRIPRSTATDKEQYGNGARTSVPPFRDRVQLELRDIRAEAAAMKETLANVLREVQELEHEDNSIPDPTERTVGAAAMVYTVISSEIENDECLSNGVREDSAKNISVSSVNKGIQKLGSQEIQVREGKRHSKPDQNGIHTHNVQSDNCVHKNKDRNHQTVDQEQSHVVSKYSVQGVQCSSDQKKAAPETNHSHEDQRSQYQQQQSEQFWKFKKENVPYSPTHQDGSPGQVAVKPSIKGLQQHSVSSSSSSSTGNSTATPVTNQVDEKKRLLSISKNFDRAEILLNSLGVVTGRHVVFTGSVRRFIESVAVALEQETPTPPKAVTMNTLLCLDISESIGTAGLQEIKKSVLKYLEGIEHIAEQFSLEENIGVVLMGEGGAWVARQFTNDYGTIREVIENLTCGGPSPMLEALCVCVAAIKEKGFTISIGMAHDVKPRIVFFTDGRPTPHEAISGRDILHDDHVVKLQVAGLVRKMAGEKDADPIIWVPVGQPDKDFLASLATLGDTQILDSKDTRSLSNYFKIEVAIGKSLLSYQENSHLFDSEEAAIGPLSDSFVYDMTADEKEKVRKGFKYRLDRCNEAPDSVGNEDYRYITVVETMPPIGSRVIRGPDWHYSGQDSGGPGTIINHTKGTRPNWHYDNQDGGEGSTGVVIRKRMDGKVKVRWEDGSICAYDFGYNGAFDLAICEPEDFMKPLRPEPVAKNNKELSAEIAEMSNKSAQSDPVWQWKDGEGVWHLYSEDHIQKLEDEFTKRPTGSCVIQKNNQGYRVFFKTPMAEKCITQSGTRHDVKRTLVSRKQKKKLLKTRAS